MTMDNVSSVGGVGKSSLVLERTAIAFMPITLIAISLRMYVRVFVVRGFGMDDVMLLMAQAFFLVFAGFAIRLIDIEHDETLVAELQSGPRGEMAVLEQVYTASIFFSMFYCFTLVLLKMSLAVFFLRIVVKQWQRIVIYVAATLMALYGLTFAFTYTFRCGTDVTHQLAARLAGKCIPDVTLIKMMYAFGALDAATDFVFATLPIIVLWGANMPRGMKITAGVLLTMGSVSSICAIIRVVTLSNLTSASQFFKQAVQTGLWSLVEPALGIVATSLAACRPLWRKFRESNSMGSFLKKAVLLRWTGASSTMSSSGKRTSKPMGLSFVERSEGLKGFKRFNDAEHGVSTATITVGEARDGSTELHDLGALEAQEELAEEDRSERSLVRQSIIPEDAKGSEKIYKTRDVRVNITESS